MHETQSMHPTSSPQQLQRPATKNRFLAALCHVNRYSGRFNGLLSRDTGLSTAVLRNILSGRCEPSYGATLRIVDAISRHASVPVRMQELIVPADEEFPTPFICDLFGCKCLPPWARDESGELRKCFEGIPPGRWRFEVPRSPTPNSPQ